MIRDLSTVIKSHLANVRANHFQENQWGERHYQAFASAKGSERGIINFVWALANYADDYRVRFGGPVGQDYVLGAEWLTIAKALRGLLNGELGRLDGGTLDRLIYDMAEAAGFERTELD